MVLDIIMSFSLEPMHFHFGNQGYDVIKLTKRIHFNYCSPTPQPVGLAHGIPLFFN